MGLSCCGVVGVMTSESATGRRVSSLERKRILSRVSENLFVCLLSPLELYNYN